MGFVNRMDQNVTKNWYQNEKNGGGSRLFEWYMLLFRVRGYSFRRHVINVIFLKYSKEGRLSSSHIGIRDMPSDDTKHYQVQSEHRRIQNPLKHLRGSVFA